MEKDQILNVDCVAGLAKLPAESVDLVFADPPFNIGYDYDVYDDRRATQDYLDWSKQWIEGVKRVLKPTGTFWLAIGDEFAAELKVLCTRDLGFHTRNWVVWFYTFGVHQSTKFTRSHAHLFYFTRDPKAFTFNSKSIRVPSARELVYGDKRADPDGRVPDDTWMMPPRLDEHVAMKDGFVLRPQDIPERFPANIDIWYYSRVAGTFGERRGWHGCQMPEQLLGRIIRACSNEGDLVLDPFGGSGTTLAVAKKLNRRFVGFELSPEYARKIEERLESIKAGDALVGPENPATSAPRTTAGRRLERTHGSAKSRQEQRHVAPTRNATAVHRAVRNGDLDSVLVEAFAAAHDGYSADRVVADPELNDRFVEACRIRQLPGKSRDWNHLLLNLRKRGKLAMIDTSRRTIVLRPAMDGYTFGSEIAWKKIGEQYSRTLDEILCDPELAARFDKLAAQIAPGFSAFEYRWGALALRKEASKGASWLSEADSDLRQRALRLSDLGRLPSAPGHYLVKLGETPFYVGFASQLNECPLFSARRLASAAEIMDTPFSEKSVEIKPRIFDISQLKMRWREGGEVEWRAARRAKLLMRFHPIANADLPSAKSTSARVS